MDKSEKFSWLVRTGYAARGLVYILFGYLALTTAGEAAGGAEAAFDFIQSVPLGTFVLYLAAIGLLAYAAFKFLSAISDIEHHGTDAKGVAHRVGHFGSGIAHSLLAWTAFKFAQTAQQSPGGQDGSQQAAGALMTWDLGAVVVGLVGLGLIVAAVMQARKAYKASFMRNVSPQAPGPVCWIGRAGHAARAVVFAVIGWSVLKSAWLESTSEVKGLGEALMSLRDDGVLYTLVAIGLLLFGVFSLIVARYSRIPDVDQVDLKPSFS